MSSRKVIEGLLQERIKKPKSKIKRSKNRKERVRVDNQEEVMKRTMIYHFKSLLNRLSLNYLVTLTIRSIQ